MVVLPGFSWLPPYLAFVIITLHSPFRPDTRAGTN